MRRVDRMYKVFIGNSCTGPFESVQEAYAGPIEEAKRIGREVTARIESPAICFVRRFVPREFGVVIEVENTEVRRVK